MIESIPRRAGKTLRTVEFFNEHVPIGTPVGYWPGVREGEPRRSVTRSAAWLMGGHSPVVMVDGYPGGIALSHVMPLPADLPVPSAGEEERRDG